MGKQATLVSSGKTFTIAPVATRNRIAITKPRIMAQVNMTTEGDVAVAEVETSPGDAIEAAPVIIETNEAEPSMDPPVKLDDTLPAKAGIPKLVWLGVAVGAWYLWKRRK